MAFESVDPQVLQAQKLTAANQAEKERLNLQAQQIANAAARDAAQAQQAKNSLESSERNAEAQRAATLRGQEMTQRGLDQRSIDDRAFQQKNIDLQREDQLKRDKFNNDRDALLRQYGMASANNGANRTNTFNYTAQTHASSYPAGGTQQQKIQWLEIANQLAKDYQTDMSANGIDKTLKERALERDLGTFDTANEEVWATLVQAVMKQLNVGKTAIDISSGFGTSIMNDQEAWHNILMNQDLSGVTTAKGQGISGWFKQKFQNLEDFVPFVTAMIGAPKEGHGIQVPPGTSAESLAGYDEFWNIFSGLDVPKYGEGIRKDPKAAALIDLVDGWRSAEKEQVKKELLDLGFTQKQIDSADLGGDISFQETMVNLQGVSPEDWNEARLVGIMQNMGMSSEEIEKAGHSVTTADWVSGVSGDTTWNPLFHPDTMKDLTEGTSTTGEDYIRPVSLNPFGDQEIVSGKAVSGDTSFMRYVGQMAKYWNDTSPGMGDNVLSAANAFMKYKASGKDDAATKLLREELGEIANRNGGAAFLVIDAMADSWGNELRYAAQGDPAMSSYAVIENAKAQGFNLEEDSEHLVGEFTKSASGLQDTMGEFSGAWNLIGKNYGGTNVLTEGFEEAAAKAFVANNPGIQAGNIPDNIVDKIMAAAKKAVGGAFAGAPEGVVESIATRMLESLDTTLLQQSGQDVMDITGQLEQLLKDENQLELDRSSDLQDLDLLKAEDIAQNQEDLERELGLLSDQYYGATPPATSPSP